MDIDTATIKKAFGAKLRQFRKARRFSQEQLAFECGLNRTYVGSVERGERNVSIVNIHKFSLALGISPKDFFNAD